MNQSINQSRLCIKNFKKQQQLTKALDKRKEKTRTKQDNVKHT